MKLPSLVGTYGAIERRLQPHISALIQDPEFHKAIGVLSGAQAIVGTVVGGLRLRVLHALDLPAGTDIVRLRRQFGELDHEIRALRLQIAHALEDRDDGR